ncbi:retrovirus-related Pol polyprotein from transposon opus [Trichonephila clavipes]|nr:retrovirus-related Pol polyprotein from transposon opus [Trichonephila clavipes]
MITSIGTFCRRVNLNERHARVCNAPSAFPSQVGNPARTRIVSERENEIKRQEREHELKRQERDELNRQEREDEIKRQEREYELEKLKIEASMMSNGFRRERNSQNEGIQEHVPVGLQKLMRTFDPKEAARGLLATDHVILNHGQVTWTTPELAPPLLTTTPHQREDVSALDRFRVHRCPTRRVFSGTGLELVTKPATIRCRQERRVHIKEEDWVTNLVGLLPLEMANLIVREPEEKANDYEHIKGMLLKRFKLSPETFKVKFKRHCKSAENIW